MHTAPQKQCERILLLQCVFLKMSESEHLHSEFYYPGEQSDAELLQLRTYNEATERKSLLLNQENKKFIASQQMLYDTMYMIKFLLTE